MKMKRENNRVSKGEGGRETSLEGISAILITRNRKEIVQNTIRHLLESIQEQGIDEIILVDNGSTDGTPDMVRAQFPKVRLVQLRSNFGVACARNIGALNASKELLLFLDDDGFLACSCLSQISRLLCEDERLAVVAFNVVEVKDVPLSYEPRATNLLAEGEALTPTLQLTYTFYGGAAMLKRSIFLSVGGFANYFFYSHEEDDLSLRLIAKGYWLAFCPQATFIHYRASEQQPSSRRQKIFYYYRNRQYMIWRNLPWQAAILESLATVIGGGVRTVFTLYFPAFLTGSAAALARLIRIIRNERFPLSREQYAQYRRLGRELMQYRHRLRDLLLDLRKGRRLDWI